VEVVTGLEAHFFISGGEGDPVEGGGPSYSYLLYERLQAPKDPLHIKKFHDDEVLLGP
jgi:hypothetical protein